MTGELGQFIGGGQSNNITNSAHSFVGGGSHNNITESNYSAIIGGDYGTISGTSSYGSHHSCICGGSYNTINNSSSNSNSCYSFIGGGNHNTITDSDYAFIGGGNSNTINGNYAAVFNFANIAGGYQIVCGRFNTESLNTSSTGTTGAAFLIGNGTSSARGNCFKVLMDGKVYSDGAYNSTGADYAEMFEWLDGNPENEDRRGLFVTLDGENIKIAESENEYIVGVISAAPSVIGDLYNNSWQGRYKTDVFGECLLQDIEEIDEKTGKVTISKSYIVNEDYDNSVEYIGRDKRKEWSAVGMLGKLVVIDDGTCEVNKFCIPSVGGIATKSNSNSGYRVLSRIDDTHIKILFK